MDMSKKPWPILSVNSIMGKVDTNPPYQRPSVWTTAQKQLLIDTIIRGYDIPKLYWRKISRPPFQYEVIDGQQRLLAIRDFISDKFTLPKNADPLDGVSLSGLKYTGLPDDLRIAFDSYALDIVLVTSGDEDEVQEMFLRLQNGTSLKAQEKRNAMPGKMRDFVKQIAGHNLFINSVDFKDSRYTYDLIAAQMCLLEIKGQPCNVKNSDLNKMYADQKGFDENSKVAKKIKRVLDYLYKMYPNKHPDLTRYGVISLYVIVSAMLDRYVITDKAKDIRKWFSDFEKYRLSEEEKDIDRQDPEIIAYHEKISNSSDSFDSIKFRHEYLSKLLFASLPDLETKDNQRDFDASQRAAIFRRDGGRCQICKTECSWDDWHADHIKPWSKGGKTIVENGQVLCPNCNLSKGARD